MPESQCITLAQIALCSRPIIVMIKNFISGFVTDCGQVVSLGKFCVALLSPFCASQNFNASFAEVNQKWR